MQSYPVGFNRLSRKSRAAYKERIDVIMDECEAEIAALPPLLRKMSRADVIHYGQLWDGKMRNMGLTMTQIAALERRPRSDISVAVRAFRVASGAE